MLASITRSGAACLANKRSTVDAMGPLIFSADVVLRRHQVGVSIMVFAGQMSDIDTELSYILGSKCACGAITVSCSKDRSQDVMSSAPAVVEHCPLHMCNQKITFGTTLKHM